MTRKFASAAGLLLVLSVTLSAQLSIQTVDVAGDNVSKGFNAASMAPCSNGEQENYNWLTSDTHGADICGAGSEGVFSVLERMECDAGANITGAQPNHAISDATLVRDFLTQATSIRNFFITRPSPRLAVVFLGHNDNCNGTIAKTNISCSGTDLDPLNYCKTKPATFERELRKGLDMIMSIGNTRIGVVAPIRVSQLCNLASKQNCQLGGTCQTLWGALNICGSLTRDCSNTRIIDSYSTMKAYRDILKAVTHEYAAIPVFGSSQLITVGGQTVGGGVKAAGTVLTYSDVPWYYRFSSNQISCCDCFNPSAQGQNILGKLLKGGLTCSRVNPCCKDTGDALIDGRCSTLTRKMTYYRGVLLD